VFWTEATSVGRTVEDPGTDRARRTKDWEKRQREHFSRLRHPRLRVLLEGYYDMQKLRLALENRLRIYSRFGLLTPDQVSTLRTVVSHLKREEKVYERMVAGELEDVPVYTRWLRHIKGIGPMMAGGLIAWIDDPGRFPTVSKLWAYCHPPGTLIATPNGHKRIESIQANEWVIGSDGKPHQVLSTFNRPYSGELIEVKARKMLPFVCTPEHPVKIARVSPHLYDPEAWAKDHNRSGKKRVIEKVEWKKARDIGIGDWLFVPKLALSERSFDSELAKFCGKYVADGYASLYREGKYKRGHVSICFGYNEDSSVYEQIGTKLGAVCKVETPNEYRLDVGRTKLAQYFRENFGWNAYNKKIPNSLLTSNLEATREFLRGYFEGDGYRKKNGVLTAATVSRALALQLQLLSTKLGVLPSVYTESKKGSFGEGLLYITALGGYDAQKLLGEPTTIRRYRHYVETEDAFLVPVETVRRIPYEGKVFNLEVVGGEFLASNCVVHNCVGKPGERKRRGERVGYNPRLKTHCWKIGTQLLKARGEYADLYRRFKEEYSRREDLKREGKGSFKLHVHLMALRKMVKIFLQHLWVRWRETEGLPVSRPYAIDRLGHAEYIPPPPLEGGTAGRTGRRKDGG